MIVKDLESVNEALQLLEAESVVRYDDRYAYTIVNDANQLEGLCLGVLARDEIAIVVPRGQEYEMPDYEVTLRKVKKERAQEKKKRIRAWVREHPELAKASSKEIPKIVSRIRKKEVRDEDIQS